MGEKCLGAVVLAGLLASGPELCAAEPNAVRQGEQALLERSFTPLTWRAQAYDNAWRRWGDLKAPPADYTAAFRERYGLHEAPYRNGGLPMGLRHTSGLLGKGLTTDCMLCHGGSIAGRSYVGLGNTSLDLQALFEDLAAADGRAPKTPFAFGNVRGTTEAAAISLFLLSYREPDLKLRKTPVDLKLQDDLVEDAPAWWLLKKKKTMYWTGSADQRSVRALMQFMLSPLNPAGTFDREEETFANIRAYLLSLQPPRYPFAIDHDLAERGKKLFTRTCSRCHGSYGESWIYPNKIVPLDEIGTDRRRAEGLSREFTAYYNRSWFAQARPGGDAYQAREGTGYQAPPLDGVWATAPYFHNGCAPTVYHVLNSKARPRFFTRSYRTGVADYDPEKLGWKVQELERGADPALPASERRKIYDTTLPGRSNGGHTYGDALTEEERRTVIEYLKTL